jgi:oligopeptide/dipeptide ABC transporter ATP-binding protein
VRDLVVGFPTKSGFIRAVDCVSLKIYSGESLGLVGESGCGKSTLALAIMGLTKEPGRIINGQVLFDNEDLLKKKDEAIRDIRGRKISMIFQNPAGSLDPVASVGSQIASVLRAHKNVDADQVNKEVLGLLQVVGLPAPDQIATKFPHELSGGMKQRVMIAMALACNPKLLTADEPTTALDVTIQAQILKLLKGLKEKFAATVLITHNLAVVAEMCDRVAVMYAGKIIEEGDVISVFEHPAHPYTEALLKSIPKLESPTETFSTIMGSVPSIGSPPTGCRFHPRCPYSKQICIEREPQEVTVSNGHSAACFKITNYAP